MADHKTPEEKLNDRFNRLRDDWIKEVNTAANEKRRLNGELNAALKVKLDAIVAKVAKLGIGKEAWKLSMLQARHYDHGDAVTDKAAEKPIDVFGDFAKVALALHAGLPLFGDEVIKDLQDAIVRRAEAEEEAEKAAKASMMDGADLAEPAEGDFPVKVGEFEEDESPARVH